MALRVTRLAQELGDWPSDTTGRASSLVPERDDSPSDKTGLRSEMARRDGREGRRLAPCKWQELNDAKGIFKRHNYRAKLSVSLVPFVKFAFANLCPTAVRTLSSSPASPTPFVSVPRSRSCQFSIVSVINSLIAIAFREDVPLHAHVLVDYARETAVFRLGRRERKKISLRC